MIAVLLRFVHWPAILVAVSLIVTPGCRKNIDVRNPGIGRMIDLNVHPSFNWQTTREVGLSVSLELPSLPAGSLARIDVFRGNPATDGKLMLSGAAGYGFPYTTRLRVSVTLQSVFLRLTSLHGHYETVEVPVQNSINYTFTGSGGEGKSAESLNDPDCQSGCDFWLSGSGPAVIDDGFTHCITEGYSGHITIRKGVLRVCGTFTGSISMGLESNSCKLIIAAGGNALINSLTMTRNCSMEVYRNGQSSIGMISMIYNSTLVNHGTVLINTNFSPPGPVLNTGSLGIDGQYMVASGAGLENWGSLTVNSGWLVHGNVQNYGAIEVFGNISFNEKSVQNNCYIKGHQEVVFNSMVYKANHGYLHGDVGVTLNMGSVVTLQNQSMISAPVFLMRSSLTGTGSGNVIKCTGSGSIEGSQTYVTGAMELLTPDGTLTSGNYPDNFRDGSVLNPLAEAATHIPADGCNPEGSGETTPGDADGDGVPDQLDDYPMDGTRAFTNWYPESSGFGTLIFEDLWPYQGDYDMNDAVIDYQYRVITNARNQVVGIHPKFYLRAVGATLKNGFGFQLDAIRPAAIAAVTGSVYKYNYIRLNENGTETDQEYAVIIAWDNADNIIHRVGPRSEFNTLPDYPAGRSDSVFIHIYFAVPQDPQVVGTPPFNPFLIKNLDRNTEIHMPDYLPTSLANPAYFGTADDDSDPATGRYYKTPKNLLWATNITEKYQYTYETIEVLWGYLHFAEWCEASGNSYPDWYRNLPGYRKDSYIYDVNY